MFSPSYSELLLNVVALNFLFEIDNYVSHLARLIGMVCDFEVPRYCHLPPVLYDREVVAPFFYKLSQMNVHLFLDTPIAPGFTAGLLYTLGTVLGPDASVVNGENLVAYLMQVR